MEMSVHTCNLTYVPARYLRSFHHRVQRTFHCGCDQEPSLCLQSWHQLSTISFLFPWMLATPLISSRFLVCCKLSFPLSYRSLRLIRSGKNISPQDFLATRLSCRKSVLPQNRLAAKPTCQKLASLQDHLVASLVCNKPSIPQDGMVARRTCSQRA
jgi:hypothetical protein